MDFDHALNHPRFKAISQFILGKYDPSGKHRDELLQSARIGLWQACQSHKKHVPFWPHASARIFGSCLDELRLIYGRTPASKARKFVSYGVRESRRHADGGPMEFCLEYRQLLKVAQGYRGRTAEAVDAYLSGAGTLAEVGWRYQRTEAWLSKRVNAFKDEALG